MKKILIINGHSNKDSLNHAISEAYKKGAKSNNAELKVLNIIDLEFKPFMSGFSKDIEPEPDILKAQEAISWADHLVWVYPTWWATIPALMKAFIEQTFLPGFAFKYKKSKKFVKWDKYLTGKSARIISTMDSPPWFYKLFIKDPGYKTMKDILNFCGIKPVKRTYFGSVKTSSVEQRKQWINNAEKLGAELK
ncbi:MAG: NADPH:quinone reductase [Bacteroidetes bacterium 4572_114]|nr:MAG: NADPH:quinone reductase [Bacteroidetes bacterium 4572_114]